ncbi:MAG: ABC transporter permease [Alphaproteobacteria bacterium]
MKDLGLVFNGLFRKTFRSLLLILAIFVAFLIFGVLASFDAALNADSDMAADDRLVVTNKINFTQPLPIAYVNRVEALPGVDRVSYTQWFGSYYQEQRNFIVGFAVDPESYLDIYDEYLLSPEEKKAFLEDQSSLLVGREVAERYGWSVGDQIPIMTNIWTRQDGSMSWPFTIRAIFDGAESQTSTNAIFLHFKYLNEGRSFSRDFIGNVIVRTTSPDVNERVIESIDTLFANSRFETRTTTEAAFQAAFVTQLGNVALIITSVTAAAFVTILLIVGNAMAGSVRERTREIAILKTLGFSGGRIGRIVFGETLVLSLLGGGLGLVGAIGAASALSGGGGFFSNLIVTPGILATGGVLIVALALATAAIPVFLAFRLSIITALGRE